MNQADIFAPIPVEPVPRVALSVAEAAKALSLSDRTITSMIARGEIPVVRIGKRRLIPVDGLREWVASKTAAPTDTDEEKAPLEDEVRP
jgi:excisionase family DNA binding protein